MPDAPKVTLSYAFLEGAGGGTHVEIRLARPKPKDRAFLEQVGAEFEKDMTSEAVILRQMLDAQQAAAAAVAEPPLPASAERFLSQPVAAR
jgi:hypothetical protein